jgi:ATP-dependent DNA helicase, RecQ family
MPKINDYLNIFRNGFLLNKKLSGIVFVDTETSLNDKKIHDFGAIKDDDGGIHTSSKHEFERYIIDSEYICGHNIIRHDLKFLSEISGIKQKKVVDTLYLSPLLFPKKPYHKLLKDDKLQTDEFNNPLNDCVKAQALFYDEINAFNTLPEENKTVYYGLLHERDEFKGFFKYLSFTADSFDLKSIILGAFDKKICKNSPLDSLIKMYPVELAYALALISTDDSNSITPPWLVHNFPYIENVLKLLCNTPCHDVQCEYCKNRLDIHRGLQSVFGYDEFRKYDGEPLQEMAVQSAVNGDSLLAVFPTGGGKSLTFQLPAIMSGRAVHGLTVVISPLQSLMKDQVDNLAERGITESVTINGLLDPISRADSFERLANGSATLLYISPEMLRSKTIEKILFARNVVRFVIDEAHCFSAWGQDFRVDYLYIGDFIRNLQEKKGLSAAIPVSCFTATAKQKVITDICDYFKRKLDIDLKLFASSSTRKNLHYSVIHTETEDDKYNMLRSLLLGNDCPTIIYVSRTKKTREIAQKLNRDGISALPFNGKMDAQEKIANQNDFIANKVRVMVATSAFGMGVDKKDVGLVIHYDISDSLENYVQEAGRAGRDPNTDAKCYVLYNDNDLDKHFILLNQTKLSISEIQQVWKAIKDFTRQRKRICCSALEIARQAGWNEEVADVETRVRTAIAALEEAGYVKRGNNVPHVFATGIMVKNMDEAHKRIDSSMLFADDDAKQNAIRILKSLISKKHIAEAIDDDAESRVDYLADMLGLTKETVINTVNLLRQEGILADSNDMSAYIDHSELKAKQICDRFAKLEQFILRTIAEEDSCFTYKALNEKALENGLNSSVKDIKTLLYFLSIKSCIKKRENAGADVINVVLCRDVDETLQKSNNRFEICRYIIESLYKNNDNKVNGTGSVQFSITSLYKDYVKQRKNNLFDKNDKCQIADVEDALLYLSKIGALKLEGGFLVIYNAMDVLRLKEMKFRYNIGDYKKLDEFYKQKQQQIHIVGEYANMMVRDYDAALQYVQDYFQLDYKLFISKYFKGERLADIEHNMTPAKYKKLFGELSSKQREIINDKQSKYIVVAAGPGSGKTRVLVHKLASLLLMEDVKHEQLLMLTFSRAAATEFKQRLIDLIGNAAYYVEIKTFHSFAFDLLGKTGNLEDAEDVVSKATQLIEKGEAEQGRINKAVIVIDEAQDMDKDEYSLVRALMQNNEEMRVIAVGDDDQTIFEFRGADGKYMQSFVDEMQAVKYEMTENYRSAFKIVGFANQFVRRISHRMKSSPCISMNLEQGLVDITRYDSANLEIPLVNQVIATYKHERACVLTNTNDEAARIVGLLLKRGINAKLIQSTDGFRFGNLAEIRYFLKLIDKDLKTPIISDDCWYNAKQTTIAMYSNSSCLDYVKEFFVAFERVNNTKYRSDLADFVFESELEDFCGEGAQTVFVSTIHKSKGREYDTVYMLLNDVSVYKDEDIRRLYVGMTRAKKNLYIHCNTDVFAQNMSAIADVRVDNEHYPAPEEITLQMTHKDVFLDFFKDKKKKILMLRAGQSLTYKNGYLKTVSGEDVAYLSKQKRSELKDWEDKGYYVQDAKINYILAWRGKDDDEETAVLLPEMILKKQTLSN